MTGSGCISVVHVVLLFTYITASPLDSGTSKDVRTPVDTDSDQVKSLKTMDLFMRGARPIQDDDSLCSSHSMADLPDDDTYIVGFEALADVGVAHHLIVLLCDGEPASQQPVWRCHRVCEHGVKQQIMYVWANAASPLRLPKDVGFRIHKRSCIVMNVHYVHKFNDSTADDTGLRILVTPQRQKYVAGVFLMMSAFVNIKPNVAVSHTDISCTFRMETSIHMFAYRTHAHEIGTVMTGYIFNGSWVEIGKANPQWPQAFYPTMRDIVAEPGDKLVVRCTYNSIGRDTLTTFGPKHKDEMCNYYIMFYTDPDEEMPTGYCNGNQLKRLVQYLPADSDTPLPPNPELEEQARGHHHTMPQSSQATERGSSRQEEVMRTLNVYITGIIGVLATTSVVALLVVICRQRQAGTRPRLAGTVRTPSFLRPQGFLGSSHKGFERLSTEGSDHEVDYESDEDEYTVLYKQNHV